MTKCELFMGIRSDMENLDTAQAVTRETGNLHVPQQVQQRCCRHPAEASLAPVCVDGRKACSDLMAARLQRVRRPGSTQTTAMAYAVPATHLRRCV